MPPIRIRLCGEPAILRGAVPIDLPASRKARALLFLLLRSSRPWRREQLCEMFWDVPNDPRASLRWSLSKLRHSLGDHAELLVASRAQVSCAPDTVVSDLDEMSAAADEEVESSRLLHLAEQALHPPLAGLDLPRSALFDTWLTSERLAADRIRARVLMRAAELPETAPDRAYLYRETAAQIAPVPARTTRAVANASAPQHDTRHDQAVRYRTTPDGVRIAYACTGSGPPLV